VGEMIPRRFLLVVTLITIVLLAADADMWTAKIVEMGGMQLFAYEVEVARPLGVT